MKIKLAILDNDKSYLKRIVAAFSTKYAEKLEIYSFTEVDVAMSYLDSAKIDVLVSSDVFEIDVTQLPKKCAFAYFVDSANVDSVNGQMAIGKFQKADLIYKQILSIYSENAGNISRLKLGEDNTRVIAFAAACGGVGTSIMSAACALHFAAQGKKVIYINLEKYGASDIFFSGEGQFDMSDIIFALKSKKANLPIKLESCVKQDVRGVYFYSKPKIALDMLELRAEDVLRLISELKLSASYDYIVLDMDFAIDRDTIKVLLETMAIVWVSDGSEIANMKIYRSYEALAILGQDADSPLINRTVLIYNKFSNKSSKAVENTGLQDIGGAPRYEHATVQQVLEQLQQMTVFDKILE